MEQPGELLTRIYCDIDEFCKAFGEYWHKHLLMDGNPAPAKCVMSLAEIMAIAVFFHLSNQRTFKWHYKNCVCTALKKYFPKTLSTTASWKWCRAPLSR